MKILLFIPFLLLFNSSVNAQLAQGSASSADRWYSHQDVKTGEHVFKQHCSSCHGDQAQGVVKDWKQPLANGKYPAPPLNGSAHAWHHRLKALDGTIQRGGIPIGGTMPSFKGKLTQHERLQAIAYFQNFWSEKIYQAWLERGGLKK
jgi:mono/diheme cytochrome c family protein